MKKTSGRKLKLHKETIRSLQNSELAEAHGGMLKANNPTATCNGCAPSPPPGGGTGQSQVVTCGVCY